MTEALPETLASAAPAPAAPLPPEPPAPPAAECVADAAEPAPQAPAASAAAKGKRRFAAAQPVLERLFQLYPKLFGQRFLPLKLGVFQDLMAAHPQAFDRDELKLALGVHTRSSRYLHSVAAGLPRHDLQGKPVAPVAPEHVALALIELHARSQAHSGQDLKPRLRAGLLKAYQGSGLSRTDYLARLPRLDPAVAELLEGVMDEVDQQRARRAALARAFESSGKTVETFAADLGLQPQAVRSALKPVCGG